MNAKILCIEASSEVCSVALNCNGTIIEYCESIPHKHSQFILPMIQKLLAEAGFALSQLDALALGCGPGSFTGIRLAASIAQGFALGLELSVIPISTLNVIAQGAYEKSKFSNVLVGLDAKMGGIYWGTYCLGAGGLMQPLFSDKLIKPEQVFECENLDNLNWFAVGNAWTIYKELLLQNCRCKIDAIEANFYPYAKYLIPIAEEKFKQGVVVSADKALPIYLREQVVSV